MLLRPFITTGGVVIILILVAIFVAAFIYTRKQRNNYLQEGKIIVRPNQFWDYAEIFTIANVTIAALLQHIDIETLRKGGVTVQQQSTSRIAFFHQGYNEKWNASLDLTNSQNGYNTYKLALHSYTVKGSSSLTELPVNLMYTAVEKAFLAFDPNISVTTEYIDRKTHRSLF